MPGTAYNSLQNPRMYEALRRQGYSKRAAARISNARRPGHRVTHKAPDYSAGAGGQIAGNLYRGAGGKFTAGSGGNQTPAQARQNARRQERSDYGRAEDALRAAEDAAIDNEPNRTKRAALRRATILARRKRIYARREQRRQMDEQDAFARNQEAQERARATAERRARRIAEVMARRAAAAQARAERQRQRDEERARKPAKQPKAPKQPSAEAIERQRKRDEDKRKREQAKAIKLRDKEDEAVFRELEARQIDAAATGKERAALRRQFAKARRERTRRRKAGYRVSAENPSSHRDPNDNRAPRPRGPLERRPPAGGTTRDIPGQKSFAVYKDARGAYRWLAISSTAYRDRDGEIISTKALIGAVAKGDTSGNRGVLRFWHVPGLDLGECDYQATAHDGKLLIESGTFYRPDYAIALKARGAGWGVSPGFLHSPDQPDRHGVFHDITIFERSICPPGKASNLFTSITTKESRMSLTPDKDTQLAALFGGRESPAYKAAVTLYESTEKAAQASGVTFKTAEPPAVEAVSLPVYELDGALYAVKEGRLMALKAAKPLTDPPDQFEAKAEMPAAEMIEAGETEEADGEAELDVEDLLSDGDVRRVAAAVIEGLSPFFDIQKQVGELKGALGGMAPQAHTTKEAPPTDPQAMIAQMIAASQASNQTVKQAQPTTAELQAQIAAMQQTIKSLQGDQPLAASSRATQSAETIVDAGNPLVAGYKAVTDNPDGIVANFMNGFVRPG
jgi:hypothetical protein